MRIAVMAAGAGCKCTNNGLNWNQKARPFGCVRLVYEFTFP